MLVLFETPAGFALFKVLDEGKLNKVEDLWKEFETSESARTMVKLKAFSKFENTAEALGATMRLVESKPSKGLCKFLKAECQGETLAVADSKLGNAIKEKLRIDCIHNNEVMELMRGLRAQLSELITGLTSQDISPMSLGLSHSLSRYKLKFSPDKVDTMIIQAIGLLDDLDKELNTYAMRVREWYGWHFPELARIVQDNIQYAKVVKLTGSRTNACNIDYSGIILEDVESELKEAVLISMGTEVSEHDMTNIKALCDQVISLSEYRGQLYDYLRSRMIAIAPNLTVLVGELVGARLIAHAGSLINLAKHPASTVQILGAEKALFRALKTKHHTPKYGLIFHASLVGQAAPKLKGKISRSLAAKSVLSIRMDALGETQDTTVGLESRAKLEARLQQLEGKVLGRISGVGKGKAQIEPYDRDRKQGIPGLLTTAKTYNPAADSIIGEATSEQKAEGELGFKKKKRIQQFSESVVEHEIEQAEKEVVTEEHLKRKKKKGKHKEQEGEAEEPLLLPVITEPAEEKPLKKRKKKSKDRDSIGGVIKPEEEVAGAEAEVHIEHDGTSLKSSKKKRKHEGEEKHTEGLESTEKKKKKKKERKETEL